MVTVAVHDAGCHLGRGELLQLVQKAARARQAQRTCSRHDAAPRFDEERRVIARNRSSVWLTADCGP